MENKNNNIWGIIIGISIILCIVLGVATVKDTQEEIITPQNKETQEQYQEIMDNKKLDKKYAVLYSNTSASNDIFNFSNRTISKGTYGDIEFKDDELLWIKKYSKEEEKVEVIKTKYSNIISVLNGYTCEDNIGFYYLTSDNEIYYFDTRLNNRGNEILVATDAIGIARFYKNYINDKNTCGGSEILYKSSDSKIYKIFIDENGIIKKENFYFIKYVNIIDAYSNEDYSLSLVNEKMKTEGYEYLKDESGKEIVVDEVYVPTNGDLSNKDKEKRVIIIDNYSNEYILDERNISNSVLKSTGNEVDNVQVIRSGVYMFSYIDGTNKTYELERIY